MTRRVADGLPEPVRVRLTRTPPVDVSHGLTEGLVLDAWTDEVSPKEASLIDPSKAGRSWFIDAVWVTAPGTGERVRILDREFEVVE